MPAHHLAPLPVQGVAIVNLTSVASTTTPSAPVHRIARLLGMSLQIKAWRSGSQTRAFCPDAIPAEMLDPCLVVDQRCESLVFLVLELSSGKGWRADYGIVDHVGAYLIGTWIFVLTVPWGNVDNPSMSDSSRGPRIRIAAQLHPQHGAYQGLRNAVHSAGATGIRHRLQLGPLPSAVRGTGWGPLRVLDHARRLGRADQPDRDRGPGHLQRLPQPRIARRHGPDGRPRRRGAIGPRDRVGLVPTRLRGVRL